MDKARERKRETQRFFVRKVLSSNSENPDASKVFPKHDSSFPPLNLRSNKKGKDVCLSRRTKCFSIPTRKKKKLDEFLSLFLSRQYLLVPYSFPENRLDKYSTKKFYGQSEREKERERNSLSFFLSLSLSRQHLLVPYSFPENRLDKYSAKNEVFFSFNAKEEETGAR